MPLCQLLLTSAGTASAPVQIRTNLYGKFKISILGLWSNVAVSTAVQITSRQFMLPFAGSMVSGTTTVGAATNQSTRYPVFLLNNPATVQYNQGYGPMSIYTEMDGSFDIFLYDMISGSANGLTFSANNIVIISLDVEPVDTKFQQETHTTSQNLAHTFTQVPIPTFGGVHILK